MKERTIIYPYNIDFYPVLRHLNSLKSLDIAGVVSPKGWGLTGKDAGSVGGGENIGIMVESNFSNMLQSCDTVLFIESYNNLDFNSFVYPKMVEAISKGKNIISTLKIEDDIINKIEEKCEEEEVYFKSYNNLNENVKDIYIYKEEIKEISTPIIFVLGLCDRTNKFEIQLSIREEFIRKGYKVSQVGSKNYCEMFGFHSFPNFMYSKKFTESEKIKLFNEYIKQIEINENPDVIVIGIPGGISPINKFVTNKFGIFAYEVSQAVTPDVSILSLIYNSYSDKDIEFIKNSVKYKLGFEIDCLNIGNNAIDWAKLEETKLLNFITVDSNSVDKKKTLLKSRYNTIYNILNLKDAKELTEYFINMLSASEDVQYV
ncbi:MULTISPECIES: TIGR04066 family peptide maturation system protein [Clostridium]|uniref:TIGR04066 family peptide maturation system protein n=1 Tax=Clostridium cibarium TaxID=2762247 RepID=A0ABR8PWR0_9CLOT|nr:MULTISPECIES: TIGR04066 family peptide maturation system protein [Clostridium]MBD7912580.1 TIGR04066 family peptide maturation system protein [Clostridium cibarium]